MARDGEVKQRQHFCHHGDTICHPKSGYVTTKLHGTSTCRCNNNAAFQTELFSSLLPSTYAGHVNLAAVKPWQLMPNRKDGSTVKFIIFRLDDFGTSVQLLSTQNCYIRFCPYLLFTYLLQNTRLSRPHHHHVLIQKSQQEMVTQKSQQEVVTQKSQQEMVIQKSQQEVVIQKSQQEMVIQK